MNKAQDASLRRQRGNKTTRHKEKAPAFGKALPGRMEVGVVMG